MPDFFDGRAHPDAVFRRISPSPQMLRPMPSLIRPFAALRPAPRVAAEVAAPPYDVLNSEEARVRAAGKPWSFLHISKPEIDLPPIVDVHSPEVYAKAAANLRRMLDAGVLVRDRRPCYYAWRMAMGAHTQTGIAVSASVAAYDNNRIRRHEFTRPDKEDDRVRQIEALDAQTGPVLLAYPDAPEVDAILAAVTGAAPSLDIVADTGVQHALWDIADAASIEVITNAFERLPALYIADGHHRSAAASRVAARRRDANPDASHEYFLAVAFPHRQLQILPYNRVVADLGTRSAEEFPRRGRQAIHRGARFGAGDAGAIRRVRTVSGADWYRLRIRPELVPPGRSGGAARRQRARRSSAGAGARHHRSTARHAHRFRRRHSRPAGARTARGPRRHGVCDLHVPDPHGRARWPLQTPAR